jgi:hypothetical protein
MDQTWESLLDSASHKVATGSASFVAELRRNLHCIGPSTQGENMAHTTKRKLSRFGLVLVTTCCSLLIAACAGPERAQGQDGPAGKCIGATCFVDVKVQNCVVSVDPDTIRVRVMFNLIQWTIKTAETPGYHFPQDGIVIESKGFAPRPTGDGQRFMVIDNKSDRRPDIKYTVRVVRDSDGVACPPLDPTIDNQ